MEATICRQLVDREFFAEILINIVDAFSYMKGDDRLLSDFLHALCKIKMQFLKQFCNLLIVVTFISLTDVYVGKRIGFVVSHATLDTGF